MTPRAPALRGQGLVEYGLILALTALFTVAHPRASSAGPLADVLAAIGEAIDAATGGTDPGPDPTR